MLLCVPRLSAQEATEKRGTVKGTVSLANASEQGATPEGILLELQPLGEGSASRTAETDAAGNYEFRDVPDGDYLLRLQRDGF